MKLWQKTGTNTNELVEKFTVGNDKVFDTLLAKYDVMGSIAHVKMLGQTGLMTNEEAEIAIKGLKEILEIAEQSKFEIEGGIEDVHSQVEYMLVQKIGDAGKKIHSGRSRNDQVAVDIKLYLRAQIIELKESVKSLFDLLISQSEKYKN